MHLPTRQQLHDALRSPEAMRLSPMGRERLRWITDFVERSCSVTETCERFGIARGTFLRWLERFDMHNLESLENRPSDHAPRTPAIAPGIVALIRAIRQQHPLEGKRQISERLRYEHGVTVSHSTVGRVIERECLYFADTPLHWRKRQRFAEDGKEHTDTHTASAVPPVCPCGWCRFTRTYWPQLRRQIAFMSVLANVALLGFFVATILWEHSRTDNDSPLRASTLDAPPALLSPDAR